MDTNKLKKFATEARNILKQGIAVKLTTLGFDKKGEVPRQMFPTPIQGGSVWNGRTETEGFYHRWMSLYNRVQQKGVNEVYEEAAYTWFNRLIAIRILQKNRLIEPVLLFADEARTPRIVDEARSGRIPRMTEDVRTHLMALLDDDTKTTEQFALLITAWCHQNPIIEKCFGSIADYTELLLPNNILAEGGFLDMLNHTEFITDEDFKSPELIGWLYQFYISERKDEVFAKKGAFEADEIPAATQIFTPNWIVKYMVENTVGRIYLDNNPYATEYKNKWKYLVEGEPTPEESKYRYEELTDLKVADLACGSGHILNECFDILYDLYISEGYTRREAIENIFRYNLTGIDLDKRAQQLATFALLLKASQKDESYADAHVLPFILTIPKQWDEEKNGNIHDSITHFFRGCETPSMIKELESAFELMKDADSLGSIMKFDISESTRFALKQAVEYWEKENFVPEIVSEMIPAMLLIQALTDMYSAIIMNPPYMGSAKMNIVLSDYVKKNYEEGKADLMTVFMQVAEYKLAKKGKYGMINLPSWLFLSTFENVRKNIVSNYQIDSLLHMGRGIFGIDWGSTAFILSKHKNIKKGSYFKLHKRNFQHIYYFHIEELFLKALNNPSFKYNFDEYRDEKGVASDITFESKEGGIQLYYSTKQKNFEIIPKTPIVYWVSERERDKYQEGLILSQFTFPRKGLDTGENAVFLRLWSEVSLHQLAWSLDSTKKWYPYNKGGEFRKWYGNREYVINWMDDGLEIKNRLTWKIKKPTIRNESFYFREGFSWSTISSSGFSARYTPEGALFDNGGCTLFSNRNLYYYGGLINSCIAKRYLEFLSPTLNFQPGDISRIVCINDYDRIELVENVTKNNICISKLDWDSRETSWDFQTNELIKQQKNSIEEAYQNYLHYWTIQFKQLHANEVELNRIFIDIYGLQAELTPEVMLKDITILQEELDDAVLSDFTTPEQLPDPTQLPIKANAVIKQLISYAIGCWMGRYRLDQPGLYIAHADVKEDEIVTYPYGDETLTIDDDGIIPVLPYECPFDDNLQTRIADFIRIAFGAGKLPENLNFIEKCMETTIEKYLDKDYWKDHKKMYQNRPIYWLWSSKKGAFRCISYMHRMDAYTAERVRSKYLLPYIEYLRNKIAELEARAAQLSVAESRKLDAHRKALDECSEYHERLQVVAEQAIAFDLDDGVIVNHAKFGDVLAKIK